jgi:methanogenic corrinoid protein MtbC1
MAIATSSFAQVIDKEDMDYIQREWGMTKQKLVESYMKLQEPQASSFWKMYNAYEVERKALGTERIKLLNEYATLVQSLTAEKADEIAKAVLKNNIAYQNLYKKYYGKAKKAVGAVNAAKFMQAEIALQTAINADMQATIPFIGEIEHAKMHH